MRQSNIAGDSGDPERTLDFARAALQDWDQLTPALRAVSLRQEALGHTLRGDLPSAERAIERGLMEVEHRTAADTDGDELTPYSPAYLEMEAATCWVQLGRPESAVTALERGLSDWLPEFRRDLGLCLARAASAYAAVEDFTQAHAAAEHALMIASETKSARTIRELHGAQRALASRGMADIAADLADGLRGVGERRRHE